MKNILIIEDSKTINNVIKKELERLDFIVNQAFTLKDAKKNLKIKKYDLIILDLHLPDGEGSELIANIKSLTKNKVIVLTSSQDEEVRKELFEYGILDYIVKDTNLLYSIKEIIKIIGKIETTNKSKILIIDDSLFVCKQILTILEPRNYILKYSLNAKNGLKKLKNEDFDLLILDMELPDIHGLEVLNYIRKERRFVDLPIIVLSGVYTAEILRNALKNGANDFLKKPFIFEEFILKIDLWIDYFKKEKAIKEKTTKLKFLNKNLEKLVSKKVQENIEKDKIMFQHSRHAQMGEMISMIAHQWRQPLNAISAAVSLINQKTKKGTLDKETSEKITKKISKYIEHLSSTIDDFRNFFKPEKEMVITDFETIYKKALNLIEISISEKNINLIADIKNIKKFLSYENELVQVVINLIKNSEDILIINKIKNPIIKIEIEKTTFSIQDNGGGIDKTIIDKVFDPYFTTKNTKEGTGIGLYMAKAIVENHCKGKLNVINTKEGAKFIIDLSHKASITTNKNNNINFHFFSKGENNDI